MLENDNFIDADRMLLTFLDRGITFENVVYELPFSRAVSLMGISERAFKDKKYNLSEKALRDAADCMSDYAKTLKDEERQFVVKLEMSLNDLADIVHDQARRPTFSSNFYSVWHTLTSSLHKNKR